MTRPHSLEHPRGTEAEGVLTPTDSPTPAATERPNGKTYRPRKPPYAEMCEDKSSGDGG